MLTHWRVPNPSPLRPKAAVIRVTRQSTLLAAKEELDVKLEAGEIKDLGSLLGVRLEAATPLPFKSYCITRDYSMGIHLIVKRSGEEDFVANIEMPVKLANKVKGVNGEGNEVENGNGNAFRGGAIVQWDGSLV
jgi:hypothetical protein